MIRQSTLSLADGVDLTAPEGIFSNNGAGSQVIVLDEEGAATASINVVTALTTSNLVASVALSAGEDDTLTVDGILTSPVVTEDGGGGNIVKNGVGTVVLTNPANNYEGTFGVNAGTLTVAGAGVLGGIASSVSLSGGTLDLNSTTQTIGTLIMSQPAASGDAITNGSVNATSYFANIGAGDLLIPVDLLGGSGGFTKINNGTVILSGTNSYTGVTTVSAGTLVATASAALPGFSTADAVVFDGGTIAVQVAGSGWTTAELDTLLANAVKTSGALGIDTTNGDFTPTAAFTETTFGGIGLNKLGPNSLTLEQANSYTGNTTLSEGTLNINNATALGSAPSNFFIASGTTIDNTSGSAVTLTNNSTITLPGDGFVFGGTQDLNLGTGAVTLNLPPNNSTRVITLNGTGRTLTFGGDSISPSRGGNTTIQVDGAGNTLVFGSLALNNSVANRTNTWSGDGNVTVNGGVLDGGNGGQRFTYSGTGTFTINGASTYTGITTVNSGVLALGSGADLSDQTAVVINTGGMMDLAAGLLDEVGSLSIDGGGLLPDGEYGSSASGADNGGMGAEAFDDFFTGTGRLVINSVVPPTPFETFAASFGLTGANSGPADDFDNDGIDNLLEFVFGGDPTISEPDIAPCVVSADGDNLLVTFQRSDASESSVTVTIELSDDLTFSTPENNIVIGADTNAGPIAPSNSSFTVVNDGGFDTITVTIPNSGATNFARVIATQ